MTQVKKRFQRLQKDVYADMKGETLFDLVQGQVREQPVVSAAVWYNMAGERLGHGCIDGQDAWIVARELKAKEVFFVLPNDEAHTSKLADPAAPGVSHVHRNCVLMITNVTVFRIVDRGVDVGHKDPNDFVRILRQDIPHHLPAVSS